jgi:hypothetical protein
LNQPSRICVVFFEKLGGPVMMPRGRAGNRRRLNPTSNAETGERR